MNAIRSIALKTVAIAVILSGNCFVCPLAVHAAAPRPASAAVQVCADEQQQPSAASALLAAAAASSTADIGSPAPVCPLEEQMTGPQNAGDIRSGSVLERPIAASDALPASRLAVPPGNPGSAAPAAQARPPDKTSVLTGTIVKIE